MLVHVDKELYSHQGFPPEPEKQYPQLLEDDLVEGNIERDCIDMLFSGSECVLFDVVLQRNNTHNKTKLLDIVRLLG
jgi:hypothetical protein